MLIHIKYWCTMRLWMQHSLTHWPWWLNVQCALAACPASVALKHRISKVIMTRRVICIKGRRSFWQKFEMLRDRLARSALNRQRSHHTK
jgi:hypothetical protein